MLLTALLLQLALPVLLLAWLLLRPARSTAGLTTQSVGTGLAILALALVTPWLVFPWWLPYAFGALWLAAVVAAGLRHLRSAAAWPAGVPGWLAFAVMSVFAGAGGWLSSVALAGRQPPDVDAMTIPLPLAAGTYLVATGGSRELVNGHMLTLATDVERLRAYRGQSYGIDLVAIDGAGLRASGLLPRDPAAYRIWGRAVLAPCHGTVIASRNDRPDMPVPEMDTEVIAGNHVVLRCGDFDLLLAHFREGSVTVSAGERVTTGQRLGAVGNSGQTAEPHLHLSAQRPGTPAEPISGEPLALLIDGRFLVRNDRVVASGPPAAMAEDPAGDDEIAARFARELDLLREQYALPGATAAYVLADGTNRAFASGFADVETQTPMTPDSRMLAASIGKTFVAATVIALAHEKRLSLDDPLSRWLGDREWLSRLPNHGTITLRQLLTHRSGLPDHVGDERFHRDFEADAGADRNLFPPQRLVGYVLGRPPLFDAGAGWSYSDTGYILLGMVIEEVTGNAYYAEVERRFLEPLALAATTPSNRPELNGLASGYTQPGNPMGLPPKTMLAAGVLAWQPGIEWTGGGLVSSSSDLARWAKRLFDGDAMPYPYLGELLRSVPIDASAPERRYAAGVAVYAAPGGSATYGHAGWIPGYVSFVRYLADEGAALAFQANTDVGMQDGMPRPIADIEARLTAIIARSRAEDSGSAR